MRGKWDVACRGSPHSVQFYAEWDDAASRLPRTVRVRGATADMRGRSAGSLPRCVPGAAAPASASPPARTTDAGAPPSAIGRARRRDGQPGAGVGSSTTRSACPSPSAHDARAPRRRVPRRRRAAPDRRPRRRSHRDRPGGRLGDERARSAASNSTASECDVDLPSRSYSVRIRAMWDDTAHRSHRNVTETALKGHSQVAQTRCHEHRCPCPEAS